ncbi:MAG: T9SS type A sorting domain-containing protein [Bacteroidia bacterium]
MIKKQFHSFSMRPLHRGLIVACTLFFTSLASFSQTVFQKSYSNVGYEKGTCVVKTTDGGYLEGGTTGTSNFGLTDFYLIKTDFAGNVLWSKAYGGTVSEYLASVIQTSDGGYMMCGTTFSFNTQPYGNIYLIKTDANGTITWQRHYGGTEYDFGSSIKQTTDGGYIVGGLTSSATAGYNDYYIMKIDALGVQQWGTAIGGIYQDEGYSVLQTEDGSYAIAGKSNSFNGGQDIMLCKLNAAGTLLWTKSYGVGPGSSSYLCNVLRQTADEGFVMVGYTDAMGAGLQDVLVVKTDSAGVHQWTKTYGGASGDFGNDIRETFSGGFVIAANTTSFGAGNSDAYVINTDVTGNVLWSVCYGDTAFDGASSIDQTADGGYIIGGQTSATGSANADFYLIKTDPSGFTGCNEMNVNTIVTSLPTITTVNTPVLSPFTSSGTANATTVLGGTATTLCTTVGVSEVIANDNMISFYPNPANEFILFSEPRNNIEIINMLGEIVISISEPVTSVSIKELSEGIYFIRTESSVAMFVIKR